MEIKRLKAVPFGTASIIKIVTGWALYEPGKGYYAFSSLRDQFGMEFVNPLERMKNYIDN